MIYTSIYIKAEERILDLRSISLKSKKDVGTFTEFLNSRDLEMDEDIDYAIVLEENDRIIASGAMSGPVLKCIAVDRNYEGEGYIGKIVTYLLLKAHHENIDSLFLFTKPENEPVFSDLGFHQIAKVDGEAVLMENMKNGLEKYLDHLSEKKVSGDRIASIVMNCNPFTKGHLFLIEKAASENDHVHIFLLDENRSLFPADVRIDLVRKGTSHLDNVTVHHSGQYIISAATFPSYFLKDSKRIIDAHGRMDLALFCDRIAPALGINRRYVGEEPLCPVTSHYNELMAEILPPAGIELIVVKRKEQDDDVISASRVRKLIAEDDFDAISEIVPQTTLQYLKSPEAQAVIKRIKGLHK
ncbi:[citrate (pro-3S)-lyase] ligase [Spirochaeta isovalerica]|uniref:[Citrate [pro-3S]-lyase] ligase n=1 Tax=Spirochaeta isovalerica TaxID=150 RepID=A0A841RC08_9SPIO|nr:[citrate (pro-3S)-lyase] ligase [Spirochaeta isovalerica]MBB6480208.1 [citrate (pro-3S)-lyase] ligase [Spirochaeta isovalerica]